MIAENSNSQSFGQAKEEGQRSYETKNMYCREYTISTQSQVDQLQAVLPIGIEYESETKFAARQQHNETISSPTEYEEAPNQLMNPKSITWMAGKTATQKTSGTGTSYISQYVGCKLTFEVAFTRWNDGTWRPATQDPNKAFVPEIVQEGVFNNILKEFPHHELSEAIER